MFKPLLKNNLSLKTDRTAAVSGGSVRFLIKKTMQLKNTLANFVNPWEAATEVLKTSVLDSKVLETGVLEGSVLGDSESLYADNLNVLQKGVLYVYPHCNTSQPIHLEKIKRIVTYATQIFKKNNIDFIIPQADMGGEFPPSNSGQYQPSQLSTYDTCVALYAGEASAPGGSVDNRNVGMSIGVLKQMI